MKTLNIHLVSDFTCDTLMSISGVIASQFPGLQIKRFLWPFVRNLDQVEEIVSSVKINNGIILFSVLEDEIEKDIVSKTSVLRNSKVIPVMDYLLAECSEYLGSTPQKIKRSGNFSSDYLARMDTITYTINHDDGRLTDDLESADIVIIGASRTSKSPTSIYLAHKGYRVANIPFISESLMPKNLQECKKPLIIGLAVNPERLIWLRESRMSADGVSNLAMGYNNMESVIDEMREFRRYCGKLACPVIDVTNKSVEETAVYIIKYFNKHQVGVDKK